MSGSLVASLGQTFWDERSRFYQNTLVDTLTPFSDRVAHGLRTLEQGGLTEPQSWAVIWRQVMVQSDMLSLNDFFVFSTFGFTLSIAIVWMARSPRKPG